MVKKIRGFMFLELLFVSHHIVNFFLSTYLKGRKIYCPKLGFTLLFVLWVHFLNKPLCEFSS